MVIALLTRTILSVEPKIVREHELFWQRSGSFRRTSHTHRHKMSDEETFEQASSGASDCFPMEAGQIKKGGFVVIRDFPCKVVDVTTSKTGKHGHAKASITALDIFTGKKLEIAAPTSHTLMVPNVKRQQWTLMDLDASGSTSLMHPDTSETRADLDIKDPELMAQAKAILESDGEAIVDVLAAMGKEEIVSVKRPLIQN
jgi:translation initiation factor 5A